MVNKCRWCLTYCVQFNFEKCYTTCSCDAKLRVFSILQDSPIIYHFDKTYCLKVDFNHLYVNNSLVLGPSSALYRSFLEHCTLTNKVVWTI